MDLKESDHDEIIALMIDQHIYFDQAAKDAIKAVDGYCLFIPRATFKLMACLDLGPQWEKFSKYPTLFTKSEFDKFMDAKK